MLTPKTIDTPQVQNPGKNIPSIILNAVRWHSVNWKIKKSNFVDRPLILFNAIYW